jgi:hypothetical protein
MSESRQLRFFNATHVGGAAYFPGGHAPAPLAPRPLRPAQPWCRGCWREESECHCAPALNQDGSLRVNASPTPTPPRLHAAMEALRCKGCGRITGCRCGPSSGDLGARIDAQIKINRQQG